MHQPTLLPSEDKLKAKAHNFILNTLTLKSMVERYATILKDKNNKFQALYNKREQNKHKKTQL